MSNKNHVHVWEWNVPPEALDCMKCGEYLDCGNIVEHMNALESQLASRDALIERLVSVAEIKFRTSMPMNEQAIEYGGKWQKLVAEYRESKDGGGK